MRMMDLINREEVHDIIAMHLSDYMTDETRLKLEMIDCKIEDCIPTVQAVPIEVLQEIREEIMQIKATKLYSTIDLKDMVLAIIDKHMEEHHD